MGISYRKIGDIEKAKEAYFKAIEINPDSRIAYNNLGFLYSKENDYPNAIKNFEQAIKVDSDFSISSYNNLFWIQLLTKQKLDNNLEKEYIKKFKNKELDNFSSYELYKILDKIINHDTTVRKDINNWKVKYTNKKLRLFSLKRIESWAHKLDDKETSKKILKFLNEIESYYI